MFKPELTRLIPEKTHEGLCMDQCIMQFTIVVSQQHHNPIEVQSGGRRLDLLLSVPVLDTIRPFKMPHPRFEV